MIRAATLSLLLGVMAGILFAFNIFSAAPNIESRVLQTEVVDEALPPEQVQPGIAEQVTKALVEAYPQRIIRAEFRNGDWAVLLRDAWFYYAEGRLLPEELRHRALEYRPIAFYNYPLELPPWTAPSPEEANRLSNMANARDTSQPRSHYFFDALYRAHNRDEAYERVKTLRFLGFAVTVHQSILEELALVEEHIRVAARTSAQVQTWISNIDTMHGWTWRNVVGSQSRSFHSYGVAIDILPRAPGNRAIYWQWAGPAWWNIPYERRHHPPDAVIRIFESYGFVWGGKWPFFDTMHSEYRPEVMILNGIEMSTLR